MFRILAGFALAALAFTAQAAVDVNEASQAELEAVRGIGPGLSDKIIGARKASTFKDWADMIHRVGGIGAGNAARFSKAGLTVGGDRFDPSTVPAAAPDRPATGTKARKVERSSVKPVAAR